VPALDPLFLTKFFEHLRSWEGYSGWEDKIAQLEQLREGRVATINKQINQARRQWQEAMDTLKNPDIRKTPQMRIDLANTCAGLEQTIASLEADAAKSVTEEEEDELTQYQIYTLLPDLIDYWGELSFTTRLRFVNALTRKVVISCPAPAFLRIAIHWKRPTWGVDVALVRRLLSNAATWTEEEDILLHEVYEKESPQTILKVFPERSWQAIKHRGARLGLVRSYPHRSGISFEQQDLSLRDLAFAKEQGIAPNDKAPHWSQLPGVPLVRGVLHSLLPE
jgi:hypothetical protein